MICFFYFVINIYIKNKKYFRKNVIDKPFFLHIKGVIKRTEGGGKHEKFKRIHQRRKRRCSAIHYRFSGYRHHLSIRIP